MPKSQIADSLPEWQLDDETIRRTFRFGDFTSAIGFVTQVALVAERANHHPDIDIRWNKVTLALTTHDADGLTTRDIELAKDIDKLI